MIQSSTAWWPLILAALLAALSLWLNQLTQPPPGDSDGGFGHDPDLVVENFVATAFDRQGHPRYTLSAARMVHYMDDDTTTLEVPHFEQHTPDAPAIWADARRGLVSANGDHVHLLDEVSMTRAAHQGMPELVMTTDYLHVTPEAESMRTDKPVRLRQGASWLEAESLYFDAKARILDLKGSVKGSYEIQR